MNIPLETVNWLLKSKGLKIRYRTKKEGVAFKLIDLPKIPKGNLLDVFPENIRINPPQDLLEVLSVDYNDLHQKAIESNILFELIDENSSIGFIEKVLEDTGQVYSHVEHKVKKLMLMLKKYGAHL